MVGKKKERGSLSCEALERSRSVRPRRRDATRGVCCGILSNYKSRRLQKIEVFGFPRSADAPPLSHASVRRASTLWGRALRRVFKPREIESLVNSCVDLASLKDTR